MTRAKAILTLLSRTISDEPVAGVIIRPGWQKRIGEYAAGLIVASATIGALIALFQPASAANLFFMRSWLFWALHALAGFTVVGLAEVVLLGTSWRRPLRVCLTLLVMPFALAPVSLFLDGRFGTVDLDEARSPNGSMAYFTEVIDIAPLSIVLMGISLLLIQRLWPTKSPTGDPMTVTFRLADRLQGVPIALGDDLIRLSAQDHYTDVVTTAGSQLISASFTDCVAKLGGIDGVQVHRSHWIAFDHIRALEPRGSTYECVMSDKTRIPVSRRRYATLRHLLRANLTL